MTLLFVVFFVIPVFTLLANSFDQPAAGRVAPHWDFVLTNFDRFFSCRAILRICVAYDLDFRFVSTLIAAVPLGYPLAYLIAKDRRALVEHGAYDSCACLNATRPASFAFTD